MGHAGIANISHYSDLVHLIEKMVKSNIPKSILDVGCGRGILGYILKIVLPNNTQIDGIDSAMKQHTEILTLIYQNLWMMSIQEFIKTQVQQNNLQYGIICANHVLEHLKREEALQVIDVFKTMSKCIILGFPRGKKGHLYATTDNPHTHKWACTIQDMEKIGFNYVNYIKNNRVFIWK